MDPNRAVSILSVVDGVALQVAQIAEPGADISFVTNTIGESSPWQRWIKKKIQSH